MRLSHALASSRLGFAITAKGESGTIGSPGRMSSRFRTSKSEVAPTSMYMSRISSTFLRSSSLSSCGGFEPTTPTTSPLRVLMTRRCASTTCPHQPPSGRNLTNPSLVTDLTMKPTSSRWPASMTRGLAAVPFFSQMKLPSRSREKLPTPLSRCSITAATFDSKPGAPCASTSCLRHSWVWSMGSPGGCRSGSRRLAAPRRSMAAPPVILGELEHAVH